MIGFTRRAMLLGGTLAFAAQTGCYAYRPAPSALAPDAQRVRVRLTGTGTTELARYLGPRVGAVDGRLVSRAPDGALTLALESVQTLDGTRQPWAGEGTIRVPAADVAALEVNTFDAQKSVLAAVALTAGIIAISVAALRTGGAQGSTGTGPGTPP